MLDPALAFALRRPARLAGWLGLLLSLFVKQVRPLAWPAAQFVVPALPGRRSMSSCSPAGPAGGARRRLRLDRRSPQPVRQRQRARRRLAPLSRLRPVRRHLDRARRAERGIPALLDPALPAPDLHVRPGSGCSLYLILRLALAAPRGTGDRLMASLRPPRPRRRLRSSPSFSRASGPSRSTAWRPARLASAGAGAADARSAHCSKAGSTSG